MVMVAGSSSNTMLRERPYTRCAPVLVLPTARAAMGLLLPVVAVVGAVTVVVGGWQFAGSHLYITPGLVR